MTTKPKIAIASDHAGVELKDRLRDMLLRAGYSVDDLGTHGKASVHYPDYANAVAKAIKTQKADVGILVCGSGIGVSIAANRHKGIRAALSHNVESAKLSRQHNDANVLCLGARLISEHLAKQMVKVFLATRFEGGRHEIRTEMLG